MQAGIGRRERDRAAEHAHRQVGPVHARVHDAERPEGGGIGRIERDRATPSVKSLLALTNALAAQVWQERFHADPLVRSAEGLGIGKPDVSAIREGVAATMEGQDISFGRIRVTVTSGPGMLGSPRGGHGLMWADFRHHPIQLTGRANGQGRRRSW